MGLCTVTCDNCRCRDPLISVFSAIWLHQVRPNGIAVRGSSRQAEFECGFLNFSPTSGQHFICDSPLRNQVDTCYLCKLKDEWWVDLEGKPTLKHAHKYLQLAISSAPKWCKIYPGWPQIPDPIRLADGGAVAPVKDVKDAILCTL